MSTNGQDWDRLAAMLIARRAELGYGGKRRASFARDRGLSHTRTIDDLENARRTNFEGATLAQVEQVYGWKAGSIAAVLAGGEPTPLASQISVSAHDWAGLTDSVTATVTRVEDRVEQLIQDIYDDPKIPDDRKRELVRLIRRAEAQRLADLQAVEDEVRRYRAAG